MKKIISGVLVCLTLTACSQTEKGAGIGAASGAIIGGLASGTWEGAAVGAAAGGAGGAIPQDQQPGRHQQPAVAGVGVADQPPRPGGRG